MAGPVFTWRAYETDWHIRRPPADGPDPDTLTVETVTELVLSYFPPAEAEDFAALLRADENLTSIETLESMLDSLHDTVSPDIPRPSMRTLLDQFRKVRPLIHGQLVLAGRPNGSEGLDSYDAACVALAYLDDEFSRTEFTTNDKARPHLLTQLHIGPKVATDLDALLALQAQIGLSPGQTSARPARKPDEAPAD